MTDQGSSNYAWPDVITDPDSRTTSEDLDAQAVAAGADPRAERAIAASGVPIEDDPIYDPVDTDAYPERPYEEAISETEKARRLQDGTATEDDEGNLVLHKHPINQEV